MIDVVTIQKIPQILFPIYKEFWYEKIKNKNWGHPQMKFHASYTSTPQLLSPSSMWNRSKRVIVSLEESQIVSFLAIWEGTKLFPHKNFYLKCCWLFWHMSTRVQNHQIRLASFYDAPMQTHKAGLTQG